MTWYLSKIVFRIICGEGNHTPQFDEQLRLILAQNENEAFEKAQHLGKQEEDAFKNTRQELVQWKFINIAELYALHELIDGAELYSRIHETDSADAYIMLTNRKAANIRRGETHRLLQLL